MSWLNLRFLGFGQTRFREVGKSPSGPLLRKGDISLIPPIRIGIKGNWGDLGIYRVQ